MKDEEEKKIEALGEAEAEAEDSKSKGMTDEEQMLSDAFDALRDGDREDFIRSMKACLYAKE